MKFLHKTVRRLKTLSVFMVKGEEKILLYQINLIPEGIHCDYRPIIEGLYDVIGEVETEKVEVPIWKNSK